MLLAVVAVLAAGVGMLERLASSRLGERLILDLRRRVFEHVQSMPIAFFTRTHTGALVSRLNNDVIGAQGAFTSALAGVVTNVITLVLTLAVMFSLSWPITLLALGLLPLFVIPARRIGRRVGALEREATAHNAAMTSQMTERFSAPGATLVKLFGRPRRRGRRVRPARRAGQRHRRALGDGDGGVLPLAHPRVRPRRQALVYGLGGYLAVRGRLDAGTVVTMALLLNQLYGPLTALGTARLDVVTALVSFERVFEVLDIEPLIAEPAHPVDLPAGPVAVELAGVRFAYPAADKVSLASLEEVAVLDDRAGDEVLHDVSFRVEPGRTVALVGRIGRRQVDARRARAAALRPRRRHRRAWPASTCATCRSTRSARPSASSPRTATSSTTRSAPTCATPRRRRPTPSCGPRSTRPASATLVRSLADGLDTVVGERGYRLSGGERQRLTIARLLLAKPRVVILDEATAHLDSQSEAAVQEALVAALAGRTAIVIAHRLSTIRAADEILVVDDGRIVERGTHGHLLAAGGRYAELHHTQFETADEESAA